MNKKITVYDMAVVGLMAAMVFVSTALLKIGPIMTPAGPTQLKTGNVICLLAGLLFGGWRGGLAAGIGSALYDLSDPTFAPSAPFTLVFFFVMGALPGLISHLGGRDGLDRKWNLLGCIAGSGSYLVLHLGKSRITLLLEGSDFRAAVTACTVKFITSGINAVFAIVVAFLLAPALHSALEKAGVMQKLRHGHSHTAPQHQQAQG